MVCLTSDTNLQSNGDGTYSLVKSDNTTSEETIDTSTSYCPTADVSYYADVDGDGEVDGIIFADLAVGGSGAWNDDSWSSYSYDAVSSSSLKEYTISEDTYTDTYFGEGYIITPVTNTTGEDRFYVMALEDVDSSYHYWYYNAYGSLPDEKIVSYSTNDFGEGLSNTEYWLEAYASETYGSAYSGTYTELWSLTDSVGTNVGTSDSIWFVPSKSEWAAFGDTFEITSSNYSSSFGLSPAYWSSSGSDTEGAYSALFAWASIANNELFDSIYVRLCTTF